MQYELTVCNLTYLVMVHASQIGNIARIFIPTHIKTL
jgi:hypothetical protein